MTSPKLPRVMYGDLTAREHAIIEAHRWQLAHVGPEDREVYVIIVDLLGLLPYKELETTIRKADQVRERGHDQ